MKTFLRCFLTLLFIPAAHAQENTLYNLDFEQRSNNGPMPMAWIRWGDYNMFLDSDSYSGRNSLKVIGDTNKGAYGGIGYWIPAISVGRMIRLEGFMKLKNVESYAGLMLRLDGKDRHPLAFSNMSQDQISGTRDWFKYSIVLPYSKETRNIVVGGILHGQGEVWFDNFSVYIDNVNILDYEKLKGEKSGLLINNSRKVNGLDFRNSLIYIWVAVILILLVVIALLVYGFFGKSIRKEKTLYSNVNQPMKSDKASHGEESVLESRGYRPDLIEALKRLEDEEEFLNIDFSLSWVAKKIDTNTTYLSKTVNQHYKKSFRDYTQDLRMSYVIRNIKDNKRFRKYSTKAMGESVGYKKPVSFSRAFKTKFGMTPSQYVKNLELVSNN